MEFIVLNKNVEQSQGVTRQFLPRDFQTDAEKTISHTGETTYKFPHRAGDKFSLIKGHILLDITDYLKSESFHHRIVAIYFAYFYIHSDGWLIWGGAWYTNGTSFHKFVSPERSIQHPHIWVQSTSGEVFFAYHNNCQI